MRIMNLSHFKNFFFCQNYFCTKICALEELGSCTPCDLSVPLAAAILVRGIDSALSTGVAVMQTVGTSTPLESERGRGPPLDLWQAAGPSQLHGRWAGRRPFSFHTERPGSVTTFLECLQAR